MKIDFTSEMTLRRTSSGSEPRGSMSGKSLREAVTSKTFCTTVNTTVART